MTRHRFLTGCIALGLLLGAGGLAGCKTVPHDPYLAGEQALADGELLRALAHLDQVAPRDERYAEARAMALAVERRMRKAQEYLMRGMQLRAEWRDREAIPWFERALEVWPDVVGAAEMIDATRSRLAMLEGPGGGAGASAKAGSDESTTATTTVDDPEIVAQTEPVDPQPAHPRPAGPGQGITLPAAPGGAAPGLDSPLQPAGTEPDGGAPIAGTAVTPPSDRPGGGAKGESAPDRGAGIRNPPPTPEQIEAARFAAAMAEVEGVLKAGQLDQGIERLQRLAESHPASPMVRTRLSRVLHQRALLRYGQGHLGAAIADWEEVMGIDPEFSSAQRFAAAARAELELRRP